MKPETSPATDPPPPEAEKEKRKNFRRPWLFIVGIILLTLLLVWLGNWALRSFTHESTDDAFLDAHIVTIAPKVAGIVEAVHVRRNEFVTNGQPLLEIDRRDFAAKLAQRRAVQDASAANIEAVKASVELIRARVVTAEASRQQARAEMATLQAAADKAASDFKRNQELRERKVISPQEFDAARTAAAATEANLRAGREKLAGEDSKLNEVKAQLEAAKALVAYSEAQLNQAKADVTSAGLDVSHTFISSPIYGRVTNKRVERGDYVQVGQAMFALVPTNFWVTANFKETQLKEIQPGQSATIEIDAVAKKVFRGHVESIQSGSGARFSLLPPENAVGNFVKVVQRVPVKVVFDEPLNLDQIVGPGMSVVPTVQVKEFRISSVLTFVVAAVLALIVGWLVWHLTDPKRKEKNASAGK